MQRVLRVLGVLGVAHHRRSHVRVRGGVPLWEEGKRRLGFEEDSDSDKDWANGRGEQRKWYSATKEMDH